MNSFFRRRLWQLVPTLFGISLVSFFLMQLAPGGPIDLMTDMNPHVTPEAKARIRKELGLDRPIPIQYIRWLGKMATFDFGLSLKDNRPVVRKIMERLPATLLLNMLSIFLMVLLAIPIGFFAALKPQSLFDRLTTIFVFVGFSVPTYAVALLATILLGLKLGWLPISGLTSMSWAPQPIWVLGLDMAKHLILPTLVLGLTSLAGLSRYMRSSMLEVIHLDFIRAAEAKGLGFWRIYGVHALRNAVIPLVTLFGLMLPDLIGGGVIIETVFAYPGMGRLGYEAIMTRDYNLVMAITVISAVLTVLGNLLADVLYAYADPRIRYQ